MTTESETPLKPETPIGVRKAIYFVGIVLASLALLVVGLVAIFWTDATIKTLAAAGVVNSVWLYVSNQLAVKYVPPVLPTSGA